MHIHVLSQPHRHRHVLKQKSMHIVRRTSKGKIIRTSTRTSKTTSKAKSIEATRKQQAATIKMKKSKRKESKPGNKNQTHKAFLINPYPLGSGINKGRNVTMTEISVLVHAILP